MNVKSILIYILIGLFYTGFAFAENTTPFPDWYYDSALGMSNAAANMTIGSVDNPIGQKINTWTRTEANDSEGAAFITGQAIGAIGTASTGGEVFGILKLSSRVKQLENANNIQKALNAEQKTLNAEQAALNAEQRAFKAEQSEINGLVADKLYLDSLLQQSSRLPKNTGE